MSKTQLVRYLGELQSHYSELQSRIETILEGDNSKLYAMYYDDRKGFDQMVESKKAQLEEELSALRQELDQILES